MGINKKTNSTNLLLTECEGCPGGYWPEVVAEQTKQSETEGQYSPVRLELARLVSIIWHSGHTCFEFAGFRKPKTYTADDHFHRNCPYGEILTKKEPIRTIGFTFPYNNNINKRRDK